MTDAPDRSRGSAPGSGEPPDAPVPDAADTIEVQRLSTPLPKRIGHYTIQGVIASGGMGTVYKAVQEHPRRAVAIKVMKAGVHTESDLRRFEFEAQLLGRLRHQGIAQIYEAGTHEEGGVAVPYFAMEYIPNAKDILTYATRKSLSIRERLDLFRQVCEAVHHGHQKGIIHRDLKPANILVGPKSNPHVIDFGVARATDSDMALTQHQTDLGQIIGTVQYMSPEQCEGDPHDIDTRSDVYSLGMVLYELLCGQLPYDLSKVPVYEATKVIRTQDPPRPSTTNPKLRGDLETIVLKALEKDRDRRYQSAGELGQDLERYLRGDAISARPASTAYQLRVFARRNKGFLAAASAVVMVLLAGVVVSSLLYVRSRSYELQAEKNETRAQGAQMYLEDVMGSLNMIMGDEIPVSRLLETFEEGIEERFSDQPEVDAAVRFHLAKQYGFLSMFRGNDDAKEYAARAERNLNQALAIQRKVYGDNNPITLATMEEAASHLGRGFDLKRAETLRREALAIRKALPDQEQEEVMRARLRLADVLIKRGKLEEAATLNAEALEFFTGQPASEDDPTGLPLWQRAKILQLQGQYAEAESIRLEMLERARNETDPESRAKAEDNARDALAHLYVTEGRLTEAEAIYTSQLPVTEETLGIKSWLLQDYALQPDAPTLLVFWAEWCPWCQLFIPPIDAAREQKSPGLQIVGLTSAGGGKQVEEAVHFVERNDIDFANAVIDFKACSRTTGRIWFPLTIALNEGKVVWRGNASDVTAGFLEGLSLGTSP